MKSRWYMIRRTFPNQDDLRLVPVWLHFWSKAAIDEFRNQSVGVPGMFLFPQGSPLRESCVMRFQVFRNRTIRYLVRLIKETGGATLSYYTEYLRLRHVLMHQCGRRVGKYGYYVLREDLGKVENAAKKINRVVSKLVSRLRMPLQYYRERKILDLFVKLREQWYQTGNPWWEPLGIDGMDDAAVYREFRRHLRNDGFKFFEHPIEWVDCHEVDPMEMYCFRGSHAFQDMVSKTFSDYLKSSGLTIEELLDLDKYEKWKRQNVLEGDVEGMSIYLSDLWRIRYDEDEDPLDGRY